MKNSYAIILHSALLSVLLGSLLLTGCTSQAPSPEPTRVASLAPTLAVSTSTSLPPTLAPTGTSLPSPTLPPTPSFTPQPTPTSTPAPTDTPVPTQTPLPPAPTKVPTRPPELSAQVLRVWSYQNKNVYVGNEGFLLAVYLKNTGTKTWRPGYQLRYTGQTDGGDITVQPVVNVTREVPPGGKIEFDMWAFGSEKLGPNTMFFALFDDTGKLVPGSRASYTYTAIHN